MALSTAVKSSKPLPEHGSLHITTSAYYPQSNGLAERTVQIAKSLMEKAKADQRDAYESPWVLSYSCRQLQITSPAAHEPSLTLNLTQHPSTASAQGGQSQGCSRKESPPTTASEEILWQISQTNVITAWRTNYPFPGTWVLETSSCHPASCHWQIIPVCSKAQNCSGLVRICKRV